MKFETQRVAVLCSKRAPGLEQLLRHPLRNRSFEIACVVTTELWLPQTFLIERAGVPVLTHPIERFCEDRGVGVRDRDARREYDAATAAMLRILDVDSVLLLGYLYVLSSALLDEFPSRIVNIHDSDLSVSTPDGERRYRGLRSTRDAILAGETSVRSTAHLVTPKLDGGPILMMSERYPVPAAATAAAERGDLPLVKKYAWIQRQAMMNDWGNLAANALELVACDLGVEVATA
ncbi:MAG TPA: formyltransferase family protein [Thermoanaerobaculia bacterium]|nr:formyltransferase family protein [Thermoanaerobaculia bacterium]